MPGNKMAVKVANAFIHGEKERQKFAYSDGKTIQLYSTIIAEKRDDGIYIQTGGFNTLTTFRYLKAIPYVSAFLAKNPEWDGNWAKI